MSEIGDESWNYLLDRASRESLFNYANNPQQHKNIKTIWKDWDRTPGIVKQVLEWLDPLFVPPKELSNANTDESKLIKSTLKNLYLKRRPLRMSEAEFLMYELSNVPQEDRYRDPSNAIGRE